MSLLKFLEKPILHVSFRCNSNTTSTLTKKWDLYSAICLERLPVTVRQYNDIEMKMDTLLRQIEYERSYTSNFEIRQKQDVARVKKLKKEIIQDLDAAPQQTANDFLDASMDELKQFQFAQQSNSKTNGDNKHPGRHLDRRLLLIVKQKFNEKNSVWLLPQGIRKNEETLRESAERILTDMCGDDVKAKFLGNAPCGFYKYKYPISLKPESYGAKIFFFKAQLLKGKIAINKNMISDYIWATRSELVTISSNEYIKSINNFLIDEEH